MRELRAGVERGQAARGHGAPGRLRAARAGLSRRGDGPNRPTPGQPRLTWAYACAGLAIASLAIGAIISLGPGHGPGLQNVATAPGPAQPRLIAPAPHRDMGLYTNTGERYNPPTKIAKHSARHKTPENIMVASAITGPTSAIDRIRVPEIKEDTAPDTAKEKLPVATAHADETRAFRADKDAPSTSIAPASADELALAGTSGTALSAVGDDKDARVRRTYDSKNDNNLAAFSVVQNRDAAAGKAESGSSALNEKLRVAAKRSLLWAAGTPAPVDDRPVAIVIASWTAPEAQPVSYGYDYTDYDAVTGRTTTVSVKRLGNHVEVRLEGNEPPVKGSVDHATIPSV